MQLTKPDPKRSPVGDQTLGTWSAEFKVVRGREEDVVDAIGNGTFGKAFEVMNELLGRK